MGKALSIPGIRIIRKTPTLSTSLTIPVLISALIPLRPLSLLADFARFPNPRRSIVRPGTLAFALFLEPVQGLPARHTALFASLSGRPKPRQGISRFLAAPAPILTAEQLIAERAALRASEAITPENMGGEGKQPFAEVDRLLRQIGGESWHGERFRSQIMTQLGWAKGQTLEKSAAAYERARQILVSTTDRGEIEREAEKQKEKENS